MRPVFLFWCDFRVFASKKNDIPRGHPKASNRLRGYSVIPALIKGENWRPVSARISSKIRMRYWIGGMHS